MKVLVLSTYELGHQPLGLAAVAGLLEAHGHLTRSNDLAVEQLPGEDLDWAESVAISVPMHTATRLALAVVERIRARRADLPVALVGLYAHVADGSPLLRGTDLLATGEFGPALLEWLAGSSEGGAAGAVRKVASRGTARQGRIPIFRRNLPGLDRYAHLVTAAGDKLAGYVEATRGCSHLCKHCPVPVVYRGRTRVVAVADVLADVASLVEAGARHITFGDPDFLNRPLHALELVRAVHIRWPDLSFDVTVKIEHVIRYERIWEELASAGLLFVVSAVESVDDRVLRLLDKGHDTAGTIRALAILRAAGIEVRPSLLPFTPWTTVAGFTRLIEFVAEHDLVDSVDPVQYGIRLLLPPGSLLLEDPDPELAASLAGFDKTALTWTWRSADDSVDRLQADVAAVAEQAAAVGQPNRSSYQEIRRLAYAYLGSPDPAAPAISRLAAEEAPVRPHLSESWFCCAEPTGIQLAQMTSS